MLSIDFSQKQFSIYALIDQKTVFIGKTQGSLAPVYYRHRRADNPKTLQYYYPPNSKNPQIHILEKLYCESNTANAHIVAWIYIFLESGYEILNPSSDREQINILKDRTPILITKLRPISMEYFLQNTRYEMPPKRLLDSNSPIIQQTSSHRQTRREKITLWTRPEVKQRFIEYAKLLNMTQGQTLAYLVSKAQSERTSDLFLDGDSDIFVKNLRAGYQREIQELNEKIHELEVSLLLNNNQHKIGAKKLNQCYQIAQKAIATFYEKCESTALIPLDIYRGTYKNYVSRIQTDLCYAYPVSSGACLIHLHAFLLGEGYAPARFVLGVDDAGTHIKLRFYPSKYFVGVNPGNRRFSKRDSVWYVAWRRTTDVAELVAAFPMQIQPLYQDSMDQHEIINNWADRIFAQCDADNFF